MKQALCKSCGAAIVWIKTTAGKSMPCDAAPVYYILKPKSGSKKVVTQNGEVLSCEYAVEPGKATGTGYIPHWSTCDKADSFRKKARIR